VNRAILGSRTPEAFAAAARGAVAAGFDAVKVAPFDGLRWEPEQERPARALIDAGLARIAAVRAAVGSGIDVLIDCHGRFNPRTATVVVREMEVIDPYWIEAPVSERDLEGWRRVRDSTSARLAGGEFLIGPEAHRRFIEATGADVVMPDVKYCGGIGGLTEVAAIAASFGTEVAPHDPSGPVSAAATGQAALAAAGPQIVEFAWGETSWRADLVGGGETIEGGRLVLGGRPGLGLSLDEAVAAAHPFEETPVGPDLWER
jgi:galactonate dehydratase